MSPEAPLRSPIQQIIQTHKSGESVGIPSICSAHPAVLETCFQLAGDIDEPLLIESTCNQVNQDGGYMNLTPRMFADALRLQAKQAGLAEQRLVLGGDHLGPYPWRKQPPDLAMAKAHQLVADYVQAGYTKIHLDASMPCLGEGLNTPLSAEVIAQRSAELCRTAEDTYQRLEGHQPPPFYVIGTEVPPPGGIQDEAAGPQVTSPEHASQTIEMTRQAFAALGLSSAWERVVAVVVQPGVEFGDQIVYPYSSTKAKALARMIENEPGLVYEAHSTDYQSRAALRQLVIDHFAILKVGPALTFAYREAIFALSCIEREWLGDRKGIQLSNLPTVLVNVMHSDPSSWQGFYTGSREEISLSLRYSFSDRCRYYWTHPEVADTVKRLHHNLSGAPIPMTLISQFLPDLYPEIAALNKPVEPQELVRKKIAAAIQPYFAAARG